MSKAVSYLTAISSSIADSIQFNPNGMITGRIFNNNNNMYLRACAKSRKMKLSCYFCDLPMDEYIKTTIITAYGPFILISSASIEFICDVCVMHIKSLPENEGPFC